MGELYWDLDIVGVPTILDNPSIGIRLDVRAALPIIIIIIIMALRFILVFVVCIIESTSRLVIITVFLPYLFAIFFGTKLGKLLLEWCFLWGGAIVSSSGREYVWSRY